MGGSPAGVEGSPPCPAHGRTGQGRSKGYDAAGRPLRQALLDGDRLVHAPRRMALARRVRAARHRDRHRDPAAPPAAGTRRAVTAPAAARRGHPRPGPAAPLFPAALRGPALPLAGKAPDAG